MRSFSRTRGVVSLVGAWQRTTVLIGVFLLMTLAEPAAGAVEPGWKVGQAIVKITPAKPLMLAGYAARLIKSKTTFLPKRS